MEGTIRSVEDHGSIVIVWIDLENGRSEPVYFEARAFRWLLEGEDCEPDNLIGRPVCFDGGIIEFLDSLEAA